MELSFNSKGNLHQDVTLTYEEFKQFFGTSPQRSEKIRAALQFLKIFHSCGCKAVYIGGSFVTTKKNPEDIDICFDISDIDAEKLEKEFPQFFDPREIGKIHRELQCHIFHFDEKNKRLLHILEEDRDGNPKGLVKLNLKDIYDQK